MGRIKTQLTKRISKELVQDYREKFKDNFEENKKAVGEMVDAHSKKMRNIIAGYVTRIVKNNKNTEV